MDISLDTKEDMLSAADDAELTAAKVNRDILYQSEKILYSRVELLNKDFKIIDSLEGNLIKDSYSISANSDIRRTYSCSMHVSNASFFMGKGNHIWIDKYIRPYVGYKHLRSGNIIWYQMGTFVFTNASYQYDAASHTLDINCDDLLCTINGTLGGQIEGLKLIAHAGDTAYAAIVALLQEAGITKYLITDIDFELPYDLEWNAGTPVSEMIKEILELYSGYEMGFDLQGSFFIRKIPQSFLEASVLDDTDLTPLLISEQFSTEFTDAANHVQVWGQVIETDRYAGNSSYSKDMYLISLEGVDKMDDLNNFVKISFKVNDTNSSSAKIKINQLEALPITDDNGNHLPAATLPANTDCVFKYRKTTKDFYYLGQYQVFGEACDDNPNSPFCKDNIGREILKVFEGGEYEKIYSDDLAEQRARYEIWKHTTLLSTLSLNLISVPWLDVNQKISYTSKNTAAEKQYIIKNISGSSSDATQTIECITFYPDYIYFT